MTASAPTPDQVNKLLAEAAPGARVYLIAAGGCGMSALGHLLLDLGFAVHGSDLVENDEVRQLRGRGAVIHLGHRAAQMKAAQPVLVVYSSAIRSDNVEVGAANELRVPIVRRATLLAALVQRKDGICVAGMHGKTTTSALLSYALTRLNAAPSYAVGAMVPQLPAHGHFEQNDDGSHRYFVAEADESDGTLREFQPAHAVILNLDEEHLDYFVNVQNVCREFEEFAKQTTRTVIFCADDPRLAEIMASHPRAISYGYHPLAQYRVEAASLSSTGRGQPSHVAAEPCNSEAGAASNLVGADKSAGEICPQLSTHFTIWCRGTPLGQFSTKLLGEKNVSNTCAAIALLHHLGYGPAEIAAAVADFAGASRRQQLLFASDQVRIYDDYGHHPNEIRATLRTFKEIAPTRLVVAFQPHRFTRTLRLMQEFAECFQEADRLVLTEVYAASEPEIPGANSAALCELLRARRQSVDYVPRLNDVAPAVAKIIRPGDLVLFIGAGDITRAAHELAAQFHQRSTASAQAILYMNKPAFEEKLRAAVSTATVIHPDEPLSRRTTLRVGGKADWYIEPASEEDLSGVLRVCAEGGVPFTIIGRGSNLLVRDGGIRGVVLCLANATFSQVQIHGEHLICGAGARLKTVSAEARRASLAGLEFLEGIPGSVGGALRMNAGAMGSWMFEVVEQIRFMDFSGNVHERKASEVNVEYRGCPLFKTHIALGAVLRGTPAAKEVIQERARQFNAKRWESQPAQPSAGCIFKNPSTIPAGKLIDELGLKGTRRGGAMISPVHGNFIVNEGQATAKDVLELIDYVKQTARKARGIELQTEVEILGE